MLTIIWNWKRKWYVFMGIKIATVWTRTGHRHQCLCQWEHIKCDICDLLFYHVHVSLLSKLYANSSFSIPFQTVFFSFFLFLIFLFTLPRHRRRQISDLHTYALFLNFLETTATLFMNDLRMTFNNASVSIYTNAF